MVRTAYSGHIGSLGKTQVLNRPFARTNSYFCSFVPQSIFYWNTLDSSIVCASSVNAFYKYLHSTSLVQFMDHVQYQPLLLFTCILVFNDKTIIEKKKTQQPHYNVMHNYLLRGIYTVAEEKAVWGSTLFDYQADTCWVMSK